jgi:hypothetical protein
MDINNLSQEIENIFGGKVLEENKEINGSKKLIKKVEKSLTKIVIQNLNGKMGRC